MKQQQALWWKTSTPRRPRIMMTMIEWRDNQKNAPLPAGLSAMPVISYGGGETRRSICFFAPAQLILRLFHTLIISFTPQSQSTLFNHRLSNNNNTPLWNSSICYGHVHLWSLPSLLCPWVVMLRRDRALPIRRTRSNMMVAVALLLNIALAQLRIDLFWSWLLFVILRTGICAGLFKCRLRFSRKRCQMCCRICSQWQWISFCHDLFYRVRSQVL